MSRLSSAATVAIRRVLRSRPGNAHGNPLPPPCGTSAFWTYEDTHGGVVADGPAVWARQADGETPGVWGPNRSEAIRRAFRGRAKAVRA